jgi:polar amino acid transport system substrate-binding protein
MVGKLVRFTLRLSLTVATGWFAIWSATPIPIQARPLSELEAPLGWREVEEDDLLDQVLAAGVLVVATDANYAPWSFVNNEGQLDGFDVDVAKEVAARLGVDLEFITPEWSAVVAGNWDEAWDVSIGSMTPTDERALVLWFTDPYYYHSAVFAVHADNTTLTSVTQLTDKRVGVTGSSFYEDYLNGVLDLGDYGGVISYPPPESVDVVSYPYDQAALVDLAEGDGVNLDAIMSSQVFIHWVIEEGIPVKYLGTPAFSEPVVFALDQARGPSDLMIAALNGIIADMRGDGTLTTISMKWLDIDITEPGPLWPECYPDCEKVFLPAVLR